MVKNRVLLRWLFFSSLIILTASYLLFFQILMPVKVKHLKAAISEKAADAAGHRFLHIRSALLNEDDITLIKILKNVVEEPDFVYARLTMPDGIALTNNGTA